MALARWERVDGSKAPVRRLLGHAERCTDVAPRRVALARGDDEGALEAGESRARLTELAQPGETDLSPARSAPTQEPRPRLVHGRMLVDTASSHKRPGQTRPFEPTTWVDRV
jgi:hypothetical protein